MQAVDEANGELQCANAEVAALRERVSELEVRGCCIGSTGCEITLESC